MNNFKRSNSAYTFKFLNRSSFSSKNGGIPKSKSFVESNRAKSKHRHQPALLEDVRLTAQEKSRNFIPKKLDGLFSSKVDDRDIVFSSFSRNLSVFNQSKHGAAPVIDEGRIFDVSEVARNQPEIESGKSSSQLLCAKKIHPNSEEKNYLNLEKRSRSISKKRLTDIRKLFSGIPRSQSFNN